MSREAAHVVAVAIFVARHIGLAAVVVRGMSASRYTHSRGGKMHIKGIKNRFENCPRFV
jgi:hypothetical protein